MEHFKSVMEQSLLPIGDQLQSAVGKQIKVIRTMRNCCLFLKLLSFAASKTSLFGGVGMIRNTCQVIVVISAVIFKHYH